MKKVRIAQIGINRYSHATGIFPTLKKLKDDYEIAGYVLVENEEELFPDLIDRYNGYPRLTLEEVLEDPTIVAVTIETEEIHLTKYALLAAQHGKHIHMEKPGSQSLADFEKLIETVRESGKVFHIGYMYRYNPMIAELQEQIRGGELGKIISVDAEMSCLHEKALREWLGVMKGGILYFLGCHLIDLVYRIQGEPLEVIPLSRSTELDGVKSEDFGFAVMTYQNGVSTVKAIDVEKGGFIRRQLVVVGSEKTVEIRPLEEFGEKLLYTTRTDYATNGWDDGGIPYSSELFDRYKGMMSAFASYVRGEKKNPYTLDYELNLFRIILKACGVI